MDSETKLKDPLFVKVNEIKPGKHCYNVFVKIITATESERTNRGGEKVKVIEGTVADETSAAQFKFVGEHTKLIQVGNVIAIRNGRSSIVDEHIILELDKFGKVTLEPTVRIDNTKSDQNISDTKWEKKVNTRTNK